MYEILEKNVQEFKEYIEQQLGNKSELLDNIFKSLSETTSCIAGGSVLSFINDEKINDLDIYVPTKNIIQFMELINTGQNCSSIKIIDKNMSSAYDQSFFKKNKIRFRYTFIITGDDYDDDMIYINPNLITPPHKSIKVDVMLIDTHFEDVITNFDLNICEIFTNGESIYTTSEENYGHIIKKNGILKNDYHKCYFEENTFILSRLKKYMLKDYEISINSSKLNLKEILILNKDLNSEEKKQLKIKDKHIDDEEEFFVKKMIERLFENYYREPFTGLIDLMYENILEYTKKLKFIKHSRNKLTEIIFVSLLEDYTLSSFRNLLIKSIDSDLDSNIFYMVIMDNMKKMKIMIRRNMIDKYNDWKFRYYIPVLWRNIIMLTRSEELSKMSKKEKFREIYTIRSKIDEIYNILIRYPPLIVNEQKIQQFQELIIKECEFEYGITSAQINKVKQEATSITNKKFIENKQHCNLVNPKMFDKHDRNRDTQLLCFESSKLGNNAIEIIDKYLVPSFQDVVQYHYYMEDERLVHIKHNIEKPYEMSGIIDYNKEAESYGVIDGETQEVSEALKTNYVFKVNEHYFHYSEDDLNELLNNKDKWMFECKDKDKDGYDTFNYEELFISLSSPNGVFTIGSEYLYSMFNAKQKVFEIIEQGRILEKTTSFKNTNIGIKMGIAEYESANHCQDGSDLKVYILKDNSNSDENSSLKPLFNNNINSEELSENKNSEPTLLKPLFNNNLGGENTHLIKKKDKKKRSIKKKDEKKRSIKKKHKKKQSIKNKRSNKKKTKRKY